jgi:hypothetical protein
MAAENKTKETDASVDAFLNAVEDEQRRKDCQAVAKLMQQVTKQKPKMWGSSIVGFGSYHYKYASGREGDAPLTGFSPRKQDLTLYISGGFEEYDDLMKRLGKCKTGKVCVYLKKLSDVDMAVLKQLVEKSVEHMKKTNP